MPSSDQVRENFIAIIEEQRPLDGRYADVERLNEEAGNGYFSLFFRAYDSARRRPVALKFFNPQMVYDSYRIKSFERESEVFSLLKGQPNMLQIVEPRKTVKLDVLTATGRPLPYEFQFVVLELALRSLKDYIESPSWDPLKALFLFRETCKGVQRLHTMGMCHRDLKPDNVLIFPRYDVRLSDFGCAKVLGGRMPSLLPFYPGPPGDLRYTSPEVLARLDFEDSFVYACDTFALGAILFELFTRTVLTLELFNPVTVNDLIRYFSLVPESDRKDVFDQSVRTLSGQVQLPSIESYTDRVPSSIRAPLNDLYRGLAALDYRIRGIDFARIFLKLNICIFILTNERRDRVQRDRKRSWRERKAEKLARFRREFPEATL